MQKAFTSNGATPDILPFSETIKDLQTEYTNILKAIIDLCEGDHRE